MREVPKVRESWKAFVIAAVGLSAGLVYGLLEMPDRLFDAVMNVIPVPEELRGDEVCNEQFLPDPFAEDTRSAEFKKRLEEMFFVACTENASKCWQSEMPVAFMHGYCFAEMGHSEQYTYFVLNEIGSFNAAKDAGQKLGARVCSKMRSGP